MKFIKRSLIILLLLLISTPMIAQESGAFEIARVKYRGGGDWYNDPSSLKNLIAFTNKEIPITIDPVFKDIALGSTEIHSYPFLFLTGHGTITANNTEVRNLRNYLENGGFLYVDDDYGLDEYIRSLLSEVFPDEELLELPFNHPIYNQAFEFKSGLPKIHEHDNGNPQGFGLFRNGKLVVFYTYESNLADGWADPEVHNDPPEVRQNALKMGANILVYALTNI
tara:strand:- start:1796 stop:2467 length:672 start_codon:yes stop_codon:yes gene_type:complete